MLDARPISEQAELALQTLVAACLCPDSTEYSHVLLDLRPPVCSASSLDRAARDLASRTESIAAATRVRAARGRLARARAGMGSISRTRARRSR